jgi:hypothetical protein
MLKMNRKLFVAAALALAFCTAGPRTAVWAQDQMADDHMKMADDDHMKMASDQMDKMKMMAADDAQAQQMTADMAKMMVMDHMAMQMVMDPKFKDMAMQSMNDPNMKKVHDDAKAMADDPAQMAKIQQDITADPKSMQMVMHMAVQMAMHDSMMAKDSMSKDDSMKDMSGDKK